MANILFQSSAVAIVSVGCVINSKIEKCLLRTDTMTVTNVNNWAK